MAELDLDPFTDVIDGPMYVVTTAADEEQAGCLVGFASQCSIDPARYMVWLSKANHTFGVARRATHLTVHVLRREQRELARWFGSETGDRVDKFERVSWRPSEAGDPGARGSLRVVRRADRGARPGR